MKLYYSPGACALVTQIILREVGQKFDLVKVDLKAKTYDGGGDFKQINPKGYVPALQLDNGEVMTEGAVILQWIADQNPTKNLIPKFGTPERYRAMEWLNFISTEMHKGFGAFFNPALNEEAKNVMKEKLQLRLAYLDNHLQANPYILGKDFSVVDAYAYNILRWSAATKVDISQHKNIMAFVARIAERPSARASIEGEGLRS